MSIFGQWAEQRNESSAIATQDGLVSGVYSIELLTLEAQVSKNSGKTNLVATYKIINHDELQGCQVRQWHSMEPRKNKETGQVITSAPPMYITYLTNILKIHDSKPEDISHIKDGDFQAIVQFIANKSESGGVYFNATITVRETDGYINANVNRLDKFVGNFSATDVSDGNDTPF